MNRIAYNKPDGCWVDANGARGDIRLAPDEVDYYCVDDDMGYVFRCFDELQDWNKSIGAIYNLQGNKVADIPSPIHPSYRGPKDSYKSRVYWIQDFADSELTMIINCNKLQDFKVIFNLNSMEFTGFSFDVR